MVIDWNFIIKFVVHLVGFILALSALFQSRTPQGATAWVLALIGFPYLSIPLYIAFGRKRYSNDFWEPSADGSHFLEEKDSFFKELENLKNRQQSSENQVELLIDGNEIYSSMISEIEKAKNYILLQVYIFRTDETGKMFARALERKSKEGVKVYILYEKVLINMSKKVLKQMSISGIKLGAFRPFERNKWHLNFRNHRKILVIDGEIGYFGGLNIGDDYVGKYPRIGHWRDTNVKIVGPSVFCAEKAFRDDWSISQGFPCEIPFREDKILKNSNVLISLSGPVDEKPICLLHHVYLINMAHSRLWIANPYIVPPQSLMDALAMAALRGVDVRIIVPSKTDNFFIGSIDEIYYEKLLGYGIKIFRYRAGFLHQKVMLIDSTFGVVGSANLDFRSMYINFEVTSISNDKDFISQLDIMFEKDFICSERIILSQIKDKYFFKKVYQRTVNLLAPIL